MKKIIYFVLMGLLCVSTFGLLTSGITNIWNYLNYLSIEVGPINLLIKGIIAIILFGIFAALIIVNFSIYGCSKSNSKIGLSNIILTIVTGFMMTAHHLFTFIETIFNGVYSYKALSTLTDVSGAQLAMRNSVSSTTVVSISILVNLAAILTLTILFICKKQENK